MKYATTYRRKATILIHSESKTVTGLRQRSEPFITLPVDADSVLIGEAILKALDASGTAVPTLTGMAELVEPLLDALDVKSWSAFVRKTVCAEVRSDGSRLFFLPTRNEGAGGGFGHLPEREFQISSDLGSAAVGEALRRAFELSEAAEYES